MNLESSNDSKDLLNKKDDSEKDKIIPNLKVAVPEIVSRATVKSTTLLQLVRGALKDDKDYGAFLILSALRKAKGGNYVEYAGNVIVKADDLSKKLEKGITLTSKTKSIFQLARSSSSAVWAETDKTTDLACLHMGLYTQETRANTLASLKKLAVDRRFLIPYHFECKNMSDVRCMIRSKFALSYCFQELYKVNPKYKKFTVGITLKALVIYFNNYSSVKESKRIEQELLTIAGIDKGKFLKEHKELMKSQAEDRLSQWKKVKTKPNELQLTFLGLILTGTYKISEVHSKTKIHIKTAKDYIKKLESESS